MTTADKARSDPRRPPFVGRRADPEPRYDAVVVGAGIGGLVAGNLLAESGLRVLVVEQHYMAGGYCSTFRRRGFVFDAATHFYPLLGNAETLTGRLLRSLDLPTEWVRMDPVDRFHLPDGSRFSVAADLDTYLDDLRSEFPAEASAIDGFFAEVRRVYLLGLLRYFRWRDVPQLDEVASLTLRDVLDRTFRSEKLKLVLSADVAHWGSPPERTSFVFDSMLRLSYFLGNYYPVGGSQVFADDLADGIVRRGGHVMLRTLARRITVADGRVVGVDLETGPPKARRRRHVATDHVVANGDLLRVCDEMLDPSTVDPDWLEGTRRLRPSMPCFLTHVGLRDTTSEELEAIAGYYWDEWDSDAVGRGALRFKLFPPTVYEPRMAPDGGQVLIVQRVTELDDDENEDEVDWADRKARLETTVLDHLRELIPDFDRRVVVACSASAQTSYRYTLNQRGSMLGWEMSPDQLGAGRPDVEGPVDGLTFVGHWTRPGGGITPVIVSAMRVAELASGRSSAVQAPARTEAPSV